GDSYTPPTGTDLCPTIATLISRNQSRTFTHRSLRPTRQSTPSLLLYGVPYSEHSSFFELTCFALSFDWSKMIATVNAGSESTRGRMSKWIERWDAEVRKRGPIEVVPHRSVDYW